MSAPRLMDAVDAAARPATVEAAAQALRGGALLGLPTETVYGLAADAANATAVQSIFTAKGRPADHPLIVHVAADDGGAAGVDYFCQQVPDFARRLMAAFWPGPLTLILPRRPAVGAVAAGGQDSIGVRCPSHPVAQALLQRLRQAGPGEQPVWGLAAPSANRFGRVSPTTAAHVASEFADLEPPLLIVDGGACDVGIESTIVDCTRGEPVLLRPGAITRDQIAAVCATPLRDKETLEAQGSHAPRASGMLVSHYAPRAKVRLMDAATLQTALDLLDDQTLPTVAVYARSALRCRVRSFLMRRMPNDAAATAHELFAVLRALDDAGAEVIWIETPPPSQDWDGVRDRVQRAAA